MSVVKKKMQQFLKKSPNASFQAALYHLDSFPDPRNPTNCFRLLSRKLPKTSDFKHNCVLWNSIEKRNRLSDENGKTMCSIAKTNPSPGSINLGSTHFGLYMEQ